MRRRSLFLAFALVGSLLRPGIPLTAAPQCGHERSSVQTGTDSDGSNVSGSSPVTTTIASLISLSRPPHLPSTKQIGPAETTIWVARGILTWYIFEKTDSDYHLVFEDESGNHMIAEIPLLDCIQGNSPFADQIATEIAREVPIGSDLARVLQERRKVRAIGGDAREYVFTRLGRRMSDVRTAFDKARQRAKLGEDVSFHTLRHTFESWYMINGGDIFRLQKYLGHSTNALTQSYAHLSSDFLRSGVEFIGPPKK